MRIAVITTITAVVLLGGATYIAVAATLIVYALGNNKAAKEKRITVGILGAFLIWIAIYTIIQIIHNSGGIF